jgi:hypothetical protein
MKAVIGHLPHNTPAQDLSDWLMSLVFDVIGVKQMTSHPSVTLRRVKNHKPPPLPNNLVEDGKISRNFPTAKPLSHRN